MIRLSKETRRILWGPIGGPLGSHCTLIHGYIKTPNTNFVFLLESMPYDVKIGPH